MRKMDSKTFLKWHEAFFHYERYLKKSEFLSFYSLIHDICDLFCFCWPLSFLTYRKNHNSSRLNRVKLKNAYLYAWQVFSEFWIFLRIDHIYMVSNVSACDDSVTIDIGNEQCMWHIEIEVHLFHVSVFILTICIYSLNL